MYWAVYFAKSPKCGFKYLKYQFGYTKRFEIRGFGYRIGIYRYIKMANEIPGEFL